MVGGCIVVEATSSSSSEPLLPIWASNARSLSHAGNKRRSFRSYLRWMCVDQSDARHAVSLGPSSSWAFLSPPSPTSSSPMPPPIRLF
ncbi:hypothetical protein GW17_00039739 [Ensete ventricosum]|nr:hypothetical protein GW17_00039739 [Ensete ventricosum]